MKKPDIDKHNATLVLHYTTGPNLYDTHPMPKPDSSLHSSEMTWTRYLLIWVLCTIAHMNSFWWKTKYQCTITDRIWCKNNVPPKIVCYHQPKAQKNNMRHSTQHSKLLTVNNTNYLHTQSIYDTYMWFSMLHVLAVNHHHLGVTPKTYTVYNLMKPSRT